MAGSAGAGYAPGRAAGRVFSRRPGLGAAGIQPVAPERRALGAVRGRDPRTRRSRGRRPPGPRHGTLPPLLDSPRHARGRGSLCALHHPGAPKAVDVAVAAYSELARGRPRSVLVSLEDALGVIERPNVPGTTTEFPNWRLALPTSLEDIEGADGMNRIADAMRATGRSANLSQA